MAAPEDRAGLCGAPVILALFASIGILTTWREVVIIQVIVIVWIMLIFLWAVIHVLNMMIQPENEETNAK